jgi:hypothetical protein
MEAKMFGRAAILALVGALALGCSASNNDDRGAQTSTSADVTVRTTAGMSDIETCSSASEWCTPAPGQIPAAVQRPLHLPYLGAGERCPTTSGHAYENELFGGIALGAGPVQPLIAVRKKSDVTPTLRGHLRFYPYYAAEGWHSLKTLWFAQPGYGGPVFIRGRQLDGPHRTVFGEAPTIVDALLRAGPTTNDGHGFREWPGATYLRAPGCYAWQIDGTNFSHVIVFKAGFRPR